MGNFGPAMAKAKKCVRCDTHLKQGRWPLYHCRSKYCRDCYIPVTAAKMRASAALKYAIKAGRLADPKTLMCVDCGSRACGYDHRNYNYPLRVAPVCKSCNWRRGPAMATWGKRSKHEIPTTIKVRDAQIIREFAKGILSKTSIGARFGVSRERVRQIVEANNARQK